MTSAGQTLRDVYLARQPIFDAQLGIYAYEVLFRSSSVNRADIEDANRSTSIVLLNAFVEIGLDRLVGKHKAFVNFTRDFLVGKFPLPLATDRLVVEILEDVEIDETLVAGVKALVEQGYTLALDDIVYRDALKPLLEIAHIVKVDLPQIPREKLPSHVERLRKYPVRLLAEKVETEEEFEYCKSLGFELFQGYFLSRPQMVRSARPRTNQMAVLQLLARSSDPEVSIDELERLVNCDPALSYKLLRYINSLKFALPRRIQSLHQAIVLLGIDGIRTLVMLVALAGVSAKSNVTLTNAIIRARLCEHLGKLRHERDANAYFTAGLLSSLDAVLDLPITEVLDSLPLSDELRDAVLHHAGPIGEAVRTVIAQERGDWSQIGFAGLEPFEVRAAYLAAISETDAMWSNLSA
jgi:c-di-GMP phosphodiesterase